MVIMQMLTSLSVARVSASRPRRSSPLNPRSPPARSSPKTSLVLATRSLLLSNRVGQAVGRSESIMLTFKQAATSQPPKRLVTVSAATATALKSKVVASSTALPRLSLTPVHSPSRFLMPSLLTFNSQLPHWQD